MSIDDWIGYYAFGCDLGINAVLNNTPADVMKWADLKTTIDVWKHSE